MDKVTTFACGLALGQIMTTTAFALYFHSGGMALISMLSILVWFTVILMMTN